jgi:hypothetical protein
LACLLSLGSGCILDRFEPEVGEQRAGLCRPEDSRPDSDVSFEDDIKPLFERSFGNAGCSCHLPTSRRTSGIDLTGLRLDDHAALLRGGDTSPDAVVPGDPCASLIVQKTSNAPPYGARMPSDGPPYLSPGEQALLRDWIAEGAHDN